MGVVGGLFGEGGEEFEGGGVVLLVEGFVGLGEEGVLLLGLGLGGVGGAGGELGLRRYRQEQECGKDHERNRQKMGTEFGEMDRCRVSFHLC